MGLSIFSGEPSDSVKGFGKSLGVYLQQISEFLSYASEEKPFPFSDWPDAGIIQSDSLKSETESILQQVPVSEKKDTDGSDVTATSSK